MSHIGKTLAASAFLLCAPAWADPASGGPAPGTVVTNTINLDYISGDRHVSVPDAASTSFTVDRKIDLSVEGRDAGGSVFAQAGQGDAVLVFSVTNSGNDVSGYDLDLAAAGGLALTYDASGQGGEGTYHVTIAPVAGAAVRTDISTTSAELTLAPGETGLVFVHVSIPVSAPDGSESHFTLTARAWDIPAGAAETETRGNGLDGTDTIFADPGLDGIETASESLVIQATRMTASKTMSVISENLTHTFDCLNGAAQPGDLSPVPRSCVEYRITVANGASASVPATAIVVEDILPDTMHYVTHAKGGFDEVTYVGGIVTGTLSRLDPGRTASFTIRAFVGGN
ncbi:hypothetical protein [Defluviimonas salinarum]|uniref:DUF11 domain-containing protein n=1 Tax=Defluviimonas salinarum TaxID=2992147 RepID=A0ABT3J910_9RHOB|nr:hypothetical protein [Defluviimonas salinarum]MCW3783925.1 hypothetical protein [Defluviimonas salinarum]